MSNLSDVLTSQEIQDGTMPPLYHHSEIQIRRRNVESTVITALGIPQIANRNELIL